MSLPYVEKKISLRRKLLSKRVGYGKFGINSDIYKPIMVYNKKNMYIGNNVVIRNGARIETIVNWKGVSYSPILLIDDNVSCEQNVHIVCAKKIHIMSGVTIGPNVMIMDNEHRYEGRDDKILQKELYLKETIIGKYTFIGKNACIMPGVTIGNRCVIGANAVVTKDIPDNSVAVGIPAKVIKKIR